MPSSIGTSVVAMVVLVTFGVAVVSVVFLAVVTSVDTSGDAVDVVASFVLVTSGTP